MRSLSRSSALSALLLCLLCLAWRVEPSTAQCGVSGLRPVASSLTCAGPTSAWAPPATGPSADATVLATCYSSGITSVQLATATASTLMASSLTCSLLNSVVGDGSTLWAACAAGGVVSINQSTIPVTVTSLIDETACVQPTTVAFRNGRVAASCYYSDVYAVDVSTPGHSPAQLTTTNECSYPNAVQIAADGTIFVACAGSGIIAIDLDGSIRQLATLDECSAPLSVFGSAADATVYATCDRGGAIAILPNGTIHTLLPPGGASCTLAYGVLRDEAQGMTIITCFAGDVLALMDDGPTFVLASSAQCVAPYAVAPGPLPGELLLSCYGSGVLLAKPQTVSVVISSEICAGPYNSQVDEHGEMWVACGSTGVFVVGPGGSQRLLTVDECSPSYQLILGEEEQRDLVFVACGEQGILAINRTSGTHSVIVTGAICTSGYGLALGTAGVLLAACYGAEAEDGSGVIGGGIVSIHLPAVLGSAAPVDAPTADVQVLTTHEECPSPYAVAADNGRGLVYAACYSGGISEIELQPSGGGGPVTRLLLSDVDCAGPYSVSVDPVGQRGFAACSSSGVYSLDLSVASPTSELLLTPDQCPSASTVLWDAVTSSLVVSCQGGLVLRLHMLFHPTEPPVLLNLLDASQCSAPPSVSVDAHGAIHAACQNGVIAITPVFRCMHGGGRYVAGSTCHPCPVNTFRNATDASPLNGCEECPTGSTTNGRIGALACSLCPPASFEQQHTCLPCAIGTAQALSGSDSCPACPPGSIAPLVGQRECTSCPVGRYHLDGTQVCAECPIGSASNVTGATECMPCDPGSVAPEPGSLICRVCPAGSRQVGQTCLECSAGTFAATAGSTSCEQCSAYTFAAESGATSCASCANSLSDAAGTTSCTCLAEWNYMAPLGCVECELGFTSRVGGVCTICPIDSYTPTATSGCRSCKGDDGLQCAGGRAYVAEQRWAVLQAPDEVGFREFRTTICPPSLCPGGLLPDTKLQGGSDVSVCQFPRKNDIHNALCAHCEDGYLPWALNCVPCTETNSGLVVAALVLLLAQALVLLLGDNEKNSGWLDVVVYWAQTSALELAPISRYLSWLSLLNLSTSSSANCIAPLTPFQQMQLNWFMPLLMLACLAFFGGVHALLLVCLPKVQVQPRGQSISTPRGTLHAEAVTGPAGRPSSLTAHAQSLSLKLRGAFTTNRYVGACVTLLLFCYTQVMVACIQYLYCSDVGDQTLLFAAPTVSCLSSAYRSNLPIVWLLIVSYGLLFPLGLMVQLYRNRELLQGTTPAASMFRQRWGALFAMQRPAAFFWQPVTLLRRLAFVLVSVFLPDAPAVRFMAYSFLNIFSLLVQNRLQPFLQPAVNQAASLSYFGLVVTSLLLTGLAPPYPAALQIVLPVILLLVAVGMFGLHAREYRQAKAAKGAAVEPVAIEMDHMADSDGGRSMKLNIHSVDKQQMGLQPFTRPNGQHPLQTHGALFEESKGVPRVSL